MLNTKEKAPINWHFTLQLTYIKDAKTLKRDTSEECKVQVDCLNDSQFDSYDKYVMKDKVNDLVRLLQAMQEKLQTA